jgi:hypothetical protein
MAKAIRGLGVALLAAIGRILGPSRNPGWVRSNRRAEDLDSM